MKAKPIQSDSTSSVLGPVLIAVAAATAAVALSFSGCQVDFSMVGGYSFDYTGETAELTQDGEFSAGISQIEIDNRFGDVKVVPADGEPKWTWESKVWADSQELADTYVEEFLMDVQTNGSIQTWTVLLPEASSGLNGVKSNLTLMIPEGVKTKVTNAHGKIEVANVTAEVELSNGHGDVSIENVAAKVIAENAHGNLVARQIQDGSFDVRHGDTDIESASSISIDSAHGNVKAEKVSGELTIQGTHSEITVSTVKENSTLKTSHGNIHATGLNGSVSTSNSHGSTTIETMGESVLINSSHGDIDLTMNSDSFTSIQCETTHADLKVRLPGGIEANINMESNHGDTKSELGSNENAAKKVTLKNAHGDIEVMESRSAPAESAESQ